MSVTGWGCDVAIVIGNNSRRNTYMFPSVCGLNPFAKISNISLLCKFLGFFCQKWLTDHRIIGYQTEIKYLTIILDQNALEFLASGKGFILDRLRLDILTRILSIIFNQNPCSPCVPWIFLGLLRKKSLEEIFNKNMAYGQKYIIGIQTELDGNNNLKQKS